MADWSLAEKYCVSDLPGASRVGARLHGILLRVEARKALTTTTRLYLDSNGLRALLALAAGEIDEETFRQHSARERSERLLRDREQVLRVGEQVSGVKEKAAAEAAEQARRAEAMDAAITARFEAIENDPVLRRRREAHELRNRFGIGYVEPEHYPRVMRLLKHVAAGNRLPPEDVAWLSTEADCWSEALQQAWHRLEAEALAEEWKKTFDAWSAVNASGHWRKAGLPDKALEITAAALAKVGPSPKLRSALCTTRGGAMRDVCRLADAEALGQEAHGLTPSDFRPCTLLGAVFMELGDHFTGHAWYQKAEALGAKRHAIDQDLRGLLVRLAPDAQERLRAYLLAQDPERFSWLKHRRPGRDERHRRGKQ